MSCAEWAHNLPVLRNTVKLGGMKPHEWTLKTLCNDARVSPRTVRYYIQQGLLPPPERAGPGATYTVSHQLRLQLILRLKAEHLPLAEIRSRIGGLTDAEVEQMVLQTGERFVQRLALQ